MPACSTPSRQDRFCWGHGAAFSAWIVLFVAQSALVRVRKVRAHRTLGWFGAALAATMVVSSFFVSVIMVRFDRTEPLDVLIVAGIFRDLIVDGRVNRVYLYVFPSMIVLQSSAMYLKGMNPSWWRAVTHAILGW